MLKLQEDEKWLYEYKSVDENLYHLFMFLYLPFISYIWQIYQTI